MKLHDRLMLYMRLKNTLEPQDAKDWPKELAEFEKMIPDGVVAARAEAAGEKYDKVVFDKFIGLLQKFDGMAQFEPPLVIPPQQHGDHLHKDWLRVGDALLNTARGDEMPEPVKAYAMMTGALRAGDSAEFNKQIVTYRASLSPDFKREPTKAARETFFNRMEPFYKAMVIYVLAFLLACAFWFNLADWLRRSAVWLVVLALVIHTSGLLFRMWLEGRPPVTNLYSSAIFIGWGACVLGLVLEGFW